LARRELDKLTLHRTLRQKQALIEFQNTVGFPGLVDFIGFGQGLAHFHGGFHRLESHDLKNADEERRVTGLR